MHISVRIPKKILNGLLEEIRNRVDEEIIMSGVSVTSNAYGVALKALKKLVGQLTYETVDPKKHGKQIRAKLLEWIVENKEQCLSFKLSSEKPSCSFFKKRTAGKNMLGYVESMIEYLNNELNLDNEPLKNIFENIRLNDLSDGNP